MATLTDISFEPGIVNASITSGIGLGHIDKVPIYVFPDTSYNTSKTFTLLKHLVFSHLKAPFGESAIVQPPVILTSFEFWTYQ